MLVRGGRYHVRKTFELTAADAGTPEAPIVYRAVPGETPIFCGGIALSGFQKVLDPAVRDWFAPAVRNIVVEVDLRRLGVSDLGAVTPRGYGKADYPTHPWVDVYWNGQALQMAPGLTRDRWPSEKFTGPVARGGAWRARRI